MLRWNGLYVERRKMCPTNRKYVSKAALNSQHSVLDLSWHQDDQDHIPHDHHNTLEQRKQQHKELVAKIYQQKLQEFESKLVSNPSS